MFTGALNVSPFGRDDHGVIGSLMDEPLRLVPSETWGDRFLVPADAELVIEGEVPPDVREVEGPFGEFTGYYGPQRVRWVIDVKAISGRHDAIHQDIFVGHRDVWTMGSFPKEGSIYNRIKGVVPGVQGVHLPISATGRYHCYISIDKRVDGESKQAALIALGECDFVKHVVVVDADIDPYNEEQVLWAIATRVQADRDVDVIRNCKGNTLDPSQEDDVMSAKMIIDATKPVHRPYEERVRVPSSAFVQNPDFYTANGLAAVVTRLRGVSVSPTAGGLHGTNIVMTKALPKGTELSTSTRLPVVAGTDLGFAVTVEDSGDSVEVHIPVTLTITGGTKPIVKNQVIDLISPKEQKTITFRNVQLDPTFFGSQSTSVKVKVNPVPNEHNVSNNSSEYPVIFTLPTQ